MARRKSSGWWSDYYYTPSRPKKVEGGVKSASKRGGFGESWWAKRWISILESFNIGARLARGRSYARSGQVASIAVDNGKVTAQVQGSAPTPYRVTIEVKTLTAREWKKIIDAMGRQALFVAKLLAGEMPQDIETLFKEEGLSLFPTKRGDLKTACSCPDASNPCKHIAATYYLLGEEFDRDPFLIFALRGLSRDELMERLGSKGAATEKASAESTALEPLPTEPLSLESRSFWNGPGEGMGDVFGVVEIPRESATLARRLGGFPFWQGETPFLDALNASYVAASPRGLDVFLGPGESVPTTETD